MIRLNIVATALQFFFSLFDNLLFGLSTGDNMTIMMLIANNPTIVIYVLGEVYLESIAVHINDAAIMVLQLRYVLAWYPPQ